MTQSRGRGNIPYGHRTVEGMIRPCPREQKVLYWIECDRRGGWGYGAIATRLNAKGYRNRRGNQWHRQSIYDLCKANGYTVGEQT